MTNRRVLGGTDRAGHGTLYYGDNLDVLRQYVPDESVDLVYLDPPFQIGKTYNILFESRAGEKAAAQIQAFEDTWKWGLESETAYRELVEGRNMEVARTVRSLRQFLGESDIMAYLCMMAMRLVELRRVLKPEGSLYLHCDPTASHCYEPLAESTLKTFTRMKARTIIMIPSSHIRQARSNNSMQRTRAAPLMLSVSRKERNSGWRAATRN